MKKETGITIISLVITIIILIILAGISINLTIGENGIITKAKQAKENVELAQIEEQEYLNQLYEQLEAEGGTSGDISYDAIAKLAEFKKAIADYIDEAGGIKPEYTAETISFGESIKGIVKEVTKNATATADNISEGKTAWVNGQLITGNGKDNKELMDVEFSINTYACPNIVEGANQIPLKNMNITNYKKIVITGSFYTSINGSLSIIAEGNIILGKITTTNNQINLEYDISSYNNLTISVFASYNRTTSTDLNIKLSNSL